MAGNTPPPPPPPPPPPRKPADEETISEASDVGETTESWASEESSSSWVDKQPHDELSKSWVDTAGSAPVDPGPSSTDLTSESGDVVGSQVTRADMGSPNQAGRRLGDFQLEKKIGQGGMGEVYRARQISLDRPVAVKVLTRGLASQPGFVERFQREAKAAANVVHPHIIQIYAYGIDNGTPYFAMEYVEGEDLQQRMRRVKRLPIDEIVDTMIAVASALAAAHEKGMIHRDVKPSNVMIDRQGNVKVMDFGLAKAASADGSLTQSGVIMGTPNYLSPEQGRGDPIDGRADLYSLGVVMYELLAGDLPFRADTPAGLIFKHVYEEPTPLRKRNAEVPPFIEEVVHKLLRKDPADRYQNGKELLLDLHEFMDAQDHYMAGGARREQRGVSTSQRMRGQVSAGGETTMTDAPVLSPDAAPTRGVRKDGSVSDQVNRSQVTIIRERSSLAPLWIVIFMAALGGGSWVLYKNGKLADWGLLSSRVQLQLSPSELPPDVTAQLVALDGSFSRDLHPNEAYFLDPGAYHLTAEKKGYQKITTDLSVQDRAGKAAFVMPGGIEFAWRFEPLPEMIQLYQRGKAALERYKVAADERDLIAAREALAKVDDPAFKPAGEEKTTKELLAEVVGSLERSEDLFKKAQGLVSEKSWREVRNMAEPLKGDLRWAVLFDQATRELAGSAKHVSDVEAARDRGDLQAALDALELVEKEDPLNPRIWELRPRIQDLKNKRDAAMKLAGPAGTEPELTAAKEALEAYLTLVPHDAAAATELARVEEKLKHDLAAPLAGALERKDWTTADTLWNELSRTQPNHPSLAAARAKIDEGKRDLAVRAAVDALDQGLESPDPLRALGRWLDGSSPEIAKELSAFADMGPAGAKVRASKHTIDAPKIEAAGNGWVARVEGDWKLDLEVEGVRMDVVRHHRMDLRLVGADWKFTGFAASEAGKPGQGNR